MNVRSVYETDNRAIFLPDVKIVRFCRTARSKNRWTN